jgi:hypothetical protein
MDHVRPYGRAVDRECAIPSQSDHVQKLDELLTWTWAEQNAMPPASRPDDCFNRVSVEVCDRGSLAHERDTQPFAMLPI